MAQVLGGTGETLILAGRGDEAKSYLDEALKLSRELKSDSKEAPTLGFQGDAHFYGGDLKSAHASYAEALQVAIRSKEPINILIAKADLAKVEVQEKRVQGVVSSLRQLVPQADELGLKYTSVECSIFIAEAMMQNRDRSPARQELSAPCCFRTSLECSP